MSVPRAPPIVAPIPLNIAWPNGSPLIIERTTLIIPPITGTLRNLPIFPKDASAFTPPLPPSFLATPVAAPLAKLVALDLPNLPPRPLTASLPNLFSAASLPNLLAYLLAALDDVTLSWLPKRLPFGPETLVCGLPLPLPPPLLSPNPPNDFAPNANVNTVMATSTAFIMPSKAPINASPPIFFIKFRVPS